MSNTWGTLVGSSAGAGWPLDSTLRMVLDAGKRGPAMQTHACGTQCTGAPLPWELLVVQLLVPVASAAGLQLQAPVQVALLLLLLLVLVLLVLLSFQLRRFLVLLALALLLLRLPPAAAAAEGILALLHPALPHAAASQSTTAAVAPPAAHLPVPHSPHSLQALCLQYLT